MCRRLHKFTTYVPTLLALWLLLGIWIAAPVGAQNAPGPDTESPAPTEDVVEVPPGAMDEAGEPPAMPMPEAPEPPEAPEVPETSGVRHGERVVIFESVTVEEDEVVREVVVIGGSLTVLGRVEREAVVVGGPARIEGRVGREVTVVGGSLYLGPESSIGRDVTVVGGTLERAETAEVRGAVNNVRLGPFFRDVDWGDVDFDFDFTPRFRWFSYGFGLFWRLMGLALLALILCFAYLVSPDAVQRVERKVQTEAAKSALVGLLCLLASIPALVLLVVLTCGLGILAVPFLLLAAVILWVVGYAALALCLGRFVAGRQSWSSGSPYMLILLGFALVEIWGFLHALIDVPALWWLAFLFGLMAFVVEFGTGITAFGAAILAWADSRRPTSAYASPVQPETPPPAEPPPSTLPPRPEPRDDEPSV